MTPATSSGSSDEETVLEYVVRQRLKPKHVADLLKYYGERPQGTEPEMAERLLATKALKLSDVLPKLSTDELKIVIRRYEIPEAEKQSGAAGILRSIDALGSPERYLLKRISDFAANQRPPRPRVPSGAQPAVSPAPFATTPAVVTGPGSQAVPVSPKATERPRSLPPSGPAPAIVGVSDQAQFESLCQFLEGYTFTKRWGDEASYEAELGGAIAGRFPGQKVVHQMAVGGTRADLVALGAVIEIKYPKTKQPLQTLTGQVEGYQRLFANRVVVVLCAGGITDTQALNDSAASLTERGVRVFIK